MSSMLQKQIEDILQNLHSANDDILLSMVITSDGLPLCYLGNSENFDLTGALYIQLKLTCDQILSDLGFGEAHEIFVRSKEGCFVVYPISQSCVLACMAKPSVNSQRLQLIAWKALVKLSGLID